MSRYPYNAGRRSPQSGLTLIELMISMTIGLVILGAVAYLYLGTRQTFRMAEGMSRIQENARYAMEILARDVRMAGYIGCGNMRNVLLNTIANPPTPSLSVANAVTGNDSGSGPASIDGITRPAGDTISIMGAFGGGVPLDGNLLPSNANVQLVGNPYGFTANDVLVVTNCTNADMFRATNVSASGAITTIAHSESSNTGKRIGSYGADAFVFKMEQYTYFIGTNPANLRSLYRSSLTQGVVELVENVQDMQIRYGIDSNDDGAADGYITASGLTAATWEQVVSAQINLLLVSPEDGLTPSSQTYTLDGVTTTAADRRLYQVITTTIGIRNRLP